MKYIYTEKDLDLISWERIDGFIDKIYKLRKFVDLVSLLIILF